MTHRPTGGWVAPRILIEHLEGPLFADWCLRAWVYLCADAEPATGAVYGSSRTWAKRYGTSSASLERWLSDMEAHGYLRRIRLDDSPCAGRLLKVAGLGWLQAPDVMGPRLEP